VFDIVVGESIIGIPVLAGTRDATVRRTDGIQFLEETL
jgi:hypothetical protein